ncbi:MAG: hypothetical protein Q8N83_09505 [Ignavibacteria bacterium]|nr:hypothetical protein [Ignavibacteria bacterium]
MSEFSTEQKYLDIFLTPIKKSLDYHPKFGNSPKEEGFSLKEFKKLYGSDPFYSWIGLNSDLMYAAHKAAGGMTSLYRQIGIGCEQLFRQIIIDKAEYSDEDYACWSYEAKTKSGFTKTLSLDARLEIGQINNITVRENVVKWLQEYSKEINIKNLPHNGIIFEVRQGYKSKDSKRQNADIDNATVAWANGYLPVFAIFSSQIDYDIVLRYRNNRCGILTGINNDDVSISLFAFSKQILGFDLAEFFQKKSRTIKNKLNFVIESLLSAK